MLSKQITVADISRLTGYSRHKVHGFLKKLGIFNARSQRERIASEYSPKDLIVLSVCCELESVYGMQRKAIGTLIEPLYKELSGPRPISETPILVINLQQETIKYLEKPTAISEGIIFPLGPILRKVDAYLTFDFGLNQSVFGHEHAPTNRHKENVSGQAEDETQNESTKSRLSKTQ